MMGLFKYYLKKRAYIVGIISFLLVLMALLLFQDGYIHKGNNYYGELVIYSKNCPITSYTIFGCILGTIIPMFEFNFKMSKVSIDEFYKFPIKKEKLHLVKFIIGFLEVIIPMTVFFLFTLFDIAISEHIFKLGQYVIFYLISIPLLLFVYSIVAFIYSKCNTTYDGIINVALVQFLFVAIAYFITSLTEQRDVCVYSSGMLCNNYWSYFFIYSPMTRLSIYYTSFMEGNMIQYDPTNDTQVISIISMVFFTIIGIVSIVLLLLLQKYEKSENSMDISSSWFLYKTMIPIFIFVLSYLCAYEGSIIVIILVLIFSYVGYVVYRRSFKIKLWDVAVTSICIAAGVIIGAIVWNSIYS